MRAGLLWTAAIALAAAAWAAQPPQSVKKAPAKGATPSKSSNTKSSGSKSSGTTYSTARKTPAKSSSAPARKSYRKAAPVQTAAHSRQLQPTQERYHEIQDALVAKGYLRPDQANGNWDQDSVDALKRFQAEQKLDASGKITAMSLIALGLGPKHDSAPLPAPPPGVPEQR
jgi:hypothetical protein